MKKQHMLVRYVLMHGSWFKLVLSWSWAGASCLGPAHDQLKPVQDQLKQAHDQLRTSLNQLPRFKTHLTSICCFFNREVRSHLHYPSNLEPTEFTPVLQNDQISLERNQGACGELQETIQRALPSTEAQYLEHQISWWLNNCGLQMVSAHRGGGEEDTAMALLQYELLLLF